LLLVSLPKGPPLRATEVSPDYIGADNYHLSHKIV